MLFTSLPSSLPFFLLFEQTLKSELKRRGTSGFAALAKKFRSMDDDGNQELNLKEFKKAMLEMNVSLSNKETRQLFEFLDADMSGTIDYEEFITIVRNPLSGRRLDLVDMAFNKMDLDGNGTIEPDEIMQAHNTAEHPDVLSGRRTEQEIAMEFLSTFEVGGEVDGMVTRDEFHNYYANISASIDNDEYFELMIRNAWGLSGGEGAAANSANKRLLVTHQDGTQTVEEIKSVQVDSRLNRQADPPVAQHAAKARAPRKAALPVYDHNDYATEIRKAATTKARVPEYGLQTIIQVP